MSSASRAVRSDVVVAAGRCDPHCVALKKTLILVCAAIAAVGIVVLVAQGNVTVLEGLVLFAMVSVLLGIIAVLDADDWSSGRGGGDGDGGGWFGGDGDGGDAG
jgi:hypothetical protein